LTLPGLKGIFRSYMEQIEKLTEAVDRAGP